MIKLDFAPAEVLSNNLEETNLRPQNALYHIGWLLLNNEINSASVRYRCFHMARGLEIQGVFSSFYTDSKELIKNIETLHAIVIVKRLDLSVIDVVAQARHKRKSIFLDICDDILADNYRPNTRHVTNIVFSGIVPLLDGIITPGAAMADRIRQYCHTIANRALPVHIIPDIAETENVFELTSSYIQKQSCKSEIFKGQKQTFSEIKEKLEYKSVLWFGNFGAPHSNFGIMSLISAIPALRSVNIDIPLELVVVSNNQAIYESMIQPLEIKTRYVNWSQDAIYKEMRIADVALLTNGNDEFCSIKSANRALQALASGVPVISSSNTALIELADCIILDDYESGLRSYLGPERDQEIEKTKPFIQEILHRFSIEEAGISWLTLMKQHVDNKNIINNSTSMNQVLFLVETGKQVDYLDQLVKKCRQANINTLFIVTSFACRNQPKLRELLIKYQIIPTIIELKHTEKPDFRRLRGTSKLIIEDKSGEISNILAIWANKLNISVRGITQFNQELDSMTQMNSINTPASNSELSSKIVLYPERPNHNGVTEWVFVTHPNTKGWILDAICREIGSRQSDTWEVVYNTKSQPAAKNYFFSHYSLYLGVYRRNRQILDNCASYIWYTHPGQETDEYLSELLEAFNNSTQVFFTCSNFLDKWLQRGLKVNKGCVVLGGADPNLFKYHKRGQGVIGLSSAFYERKNPDVLLDLVKMLPSRCFHLIGRNWEQYKHFNELVSAPNFKYLTASYEEYPKLYSTFDVFLSMSILEGGPIPLLEAMMSNVVPVASNTGFAPDLIHHGDNGYIFDLDATAQEIRILIESAFSLDANIRETVQRYTWDHFAESILRFSK